MKIYLTITPFFPSPETWRGAFVYDQVRAIQRTGKFRVVVVNTNARSNYVYEGIEVLSLKVLWKGFICCPWIYERINTARLLKTLSVYDIRLKDIMVVHTHLIQLAFFAKQIKYMNPQITTIVQFHDADPYLTIGDDKNNLGGLKRGIYFCYYRSLAESIDVCVAISRKVLDVALTCPKQECFGHYSLVQRAKRGLKFCRQPKLKQILLLHNGVDLRQFNASERKPHKGFIIGCVGNFTVIKNQITLLKAINKIKKNLGDWRLYFVGSGELLQYCKEYVVEHQLEKNVFFKTEVYHEFLPEFYRSLDLFVLPSYFEGFGCVFAESYACGTPFITCKGQGIEDIIPNDSRDVWLCEIQDADDLSMKILRFYRERPRLEITESIDIDELIPRFLDIIVKTDYEI